jgi:hypothetical protein
VLYTCGFEMMHKSVLCTDVEVVSDPATLATPSISYFYTILDREEHLHCNNKL